MNKIAAFIFGIVVGGIGSGIGVHLYYKNRIDRIEGRLDMCKARIDNLLKPIDEDDDIPDKYKRVKKEEPSNTEETTKLSKEDMDVIRQKLRTNNDKTIEYSKMYQSPSDIVDDIASADTEIGEPTPGDEGFDDADEATKKATNIFEEIKKTVKTRAPRIVKEEDVDNEAEGWDIKTLFLYNNDVLTNEDDVVLTNDDRDTMIGNCLTKYDFINSSEKTIYVQCFALNTFYEITKFDKPFNE